MLITETKAFFMFVYLSRCILHCRSPVLVILQIQQNSPSQKCDVYISFFQGVTFTFGMYLYNLLCFYPEFNLEVVQGPVWLHMFLLSGQQSKIIILY